MWNISPLTSRPASWSLGAGHMTDSRWDERPFQTQSWKFKTHKKNNLWLSQLKRNIPETSWLVNLCSWQSQSQSSKKYKPDIHMYTLFDAFRWICGTRTRTGTWSRWTPRLRRWARHPSSTSGSTSPSSTCQSSGTFSRWWFVHWLFVDIFCTYISSSPGARS